MNTLSSNNPPAPPSIIAAVRGGFDAITNQVGILIFPIIVDLYLWLGPHLRIKSLIIRFFNELNQYPGWKESPSYGLIESNMDMINQVTDRINLMTLLRTYPVGIPSLMAGRQPISTPVYEPVFWNATSIGAALIYALILLLVGLAAGTLFYQFVAQVASNERMDFRKNLRDFPRAFMQIVILILGLISILILISIPASCLLSLTVMGGLSVSQFMIFLYLGFLIWILFPLILTPQVIILGKSNLVSALKNSLNITKMTLPSTGMLFAVIILISEGLDILWRIPEENSWLNILSIFGHAFITTSLLTSTFIYYRDAENWVHSVVRKILLSSATK